MKYTITFDASSIFEGKIFLDADSARMWASGQTSNQCFDLNEEGDEGVDELIYSGKILELVKVINEAPFPDFFFWRFQ